MRDLFKTNEHVMKALCCNPLNNVMCCQFYIVLLKYVRPNSSAKSQAQLFLKITHYNRVIHDGVKTYILSCKVTY